MGHFFNPTPAVFTGGVQAYAPKCVPPAIEAGPLPFTDLGTLGGTGASSANQASLVLTLTINPISIGNLVVIAIADDNQGAGADADGLEVSSITDNAAGGSNTYTKALGWANNNAAAQAGAAVQVWYSVAARAVPLTTGQITVNFASATLSDATGMTARIFSFSGTRIGVATTNTSSVDAGAPGSLDATTSNLPYLRVRGIAGEIGTSVALTPTANWTTWSTGNSATSGTTAQMCVRAEHHISTGVSDFSNPTWTGAPDIANAYVVFQVLPDVPPPAQKGIAALTQGNYGFPERQRKRFWFDGIYAGETNAPLPVNTNNPPFDARRLGIVSEIVVAWQPPDPQPFQGGRQPGEPKPDPAGVPGWSIDPPPMPLEMIVTDGPFETLPTLLRPLPPVVLQVLPPDGPMHPMRRAGSMTPIGMWQPPDPWPFEGGQQPSGPRMTAATFPGAVINPPPILYEGRDPRTIETVLTWQPPDPQPNLGRGPMSPALPTIPQPPTVHEGRDPREMDINRAWQPPDPQPFQGGRQAGEVRKLAPSLLDVPVTIPPFVHMGRQARIHTAIMAWQPPPPEPFQGGRQPTQKLNLPVSQTAVTVNNPPFGRREAYVKIISNISASWVIPQPITPWKLAYQAQQGITPTTAFGYQYLGIRISVGM